MGLSSYQSVLERCAPGSHRTGDGTVVDFRFFGSETFVYFSYSHGMKFGPFPLGAGGVAKRALFS